jgi:hypothetical protein
MALHRDIYWVGRQWAVTGYGVQAVDQKQKGKFDIEASRLWEDAGLESVGRERWLNLDDFEKAVAGGPQAFSGTGAKSRVASGERRAADGNCSGLEETSPEESPRQHRHRCLRYSICGLGAACKIRATMAHSDQAMTRRRYRQHK